jgi:hypothetical protein
LAGRTAGNFFIVEFTTMAQAKKPAAAAKPAKSTKAQPAAKGKPAAKKGK